MSDYASYWDNRAKKAKDFNDAVGAGKFLPNKRSIDYVNNSILKIIRKNDLSYCLDAGCGYGMYIPLLLKYYNNVTAMDFSESMLELAKENLKNYKNIDFVKGSILNMPFDNESIQNIFCKSTLQCLSLGDVKIALNEFNRVLKPGGRLLLHIKNSTNLGFSLLLLKKIITFNFGSYSTLRQEVKPVNYKENFSVDKAFARPLTLYFRMFNENGFRYVDIFSFQCYSLKYLHKKGIAKRWETIELFLRKIPIIKSILKKEGIDCYILLEKFKHE